jgi:hypothetical protein
VQWSDVIAPPKAKVLRQFAGLWLVFFVGGAAWRAWHGNTGLRTDVFAVVGLVVGTVGLWRPAAVRWLYTGCMIATFPIGVVVSQVMVAVIFYGVITPVGLVFRAVGRDPLTVRPVVKASYWTAKPRAQGPSDYLRQS